jgi:hypothetical protein
VNTTYLCGEAGCLALGVGFVTAILLLALIGWIYVTWQEWAVGYLEEMEEDIRRERDLKATDQNEDAA